MSQRNLTQLALPYSVECPAFAGRFLGSAKITSDQPIAVVVHQYYQALVNGQWHYKLLTYNGFTTRGKNLFVPGYMRNHYNYYSSLTILNPNPYQMAEVRLTYIADGNFSIPQNGVVDSGLIVIGAEKSMNRFEGPTGSNAQTDLEGFTRFFGSVKIESNIPVIALVNQESTAAAGNQAGAYSAFFVGEGTDTVVVPIIQSAFYGGSYTSLSIMAIGNADADVAITYTSDNQYSTVKNRSKTYYHSTQNGFLNRYEGPTSTSIQSDILDDTFWRDPLTGARYFIGTAVIRSANAKPIVAFVNSESTTALYANVRDSMYTYNAFSLWR